MTPATAKAILVKIARENPELTDDALVGIEAMTDDELAEAMAEKLNDITPEEALRQKLWHGAKVRVGRSTTRRIETFIQFPRASVPPKETIYLEVWPQSMFRGEYFYTTSRYDNDYDVQFIVGPPDFERKHDGRLNGECAFLSPMHISFVASHDYPPAPIPIPIPVPTCRVGCPIQIEITNHSEKVLEFLGCLKGTVAT